SGVTTWGELAASIAHEINQPLAAVVADANACLNWLAADPPALGEIRGALGAIADDANRAALVLTRIRALLARSTVARQPCQVGEVIGAVLPLARPELSRPGVAPGLSLPAALPPL